MNLFAPNSFAIISLSELISTPIISEAPASLQPKRVDKPIAPKPQTAHFAPGCTLAILSALPCPVPTAQPIMQTFFKSAEGLT